MSYVSSLDIAVEQLNELYHEFKDSGGGTVEQRLALGQLAAQVEIAERLGGIEKSIDMQGA